MARRLLIAALLLATGCPKHPSSPTEAPDAGRVPSTPVAIAVTAGRTDLIFSYQEASGAYRDVTRIEDVPEALRHQVLVRDLSLKPEEVHADEFLYVADLSSPEDGGYPYALVSRYRFHLPEAADDDGGVAEAKVVVYGTSWCGACAQARKYLGAKGIPFEDKDVEKDPAAAQELARKARRAHMTFRGVPVIDVRGKLMEGFDPHAVDQALRSGGRP